MAAARPFWRAAICETSARSEGAPSAADRVGLRLTPQLALAAMMSKLRPALAARVEYRRHRPDESLPATVGTQQLGEDTKLKDEIESFIVLPSGQE